MFATVVQHARCPICGYRNTGLAMGGATPRIRTLRIDAPIIRAIPYRCEECRGPLGFGLYDHGRPDAKTMQAWDAWRQRTRERQRDRRATARATAEVMP